MLKCMRIISHTHLSSSIQGRKKCILTTGYAGGLDCVRVHKYIGSSLAGLELYTYCSAHMHSLPQKMEVDGAGAMMQDDDALLVLLLMLLCLLLKLL